MGLSVDWCTCNIGATKPEESGWYFQWGGTTPYNSDRTPVSGGSAINFTNDSNCPYLVSFPYDSYKWSKYTVTNDYSSTGTADNKLILDLEDDAAHVHLGDNWRMPTAEEYQELIDACNTEWIENYNNTGINGQLFILKTNDTKKLFFPASGMLEKTSLNDFSLYGHYLSSSINIESSDYCKYLSFYSAYYNVSYTYRFYGLPVRAVKLKN